MYASLLVAVLLADSAAQAGKPQDPGLPYSSWVEPAPGIHWTLNIVHDVTTADSLWVESWISNHSDRPFRFDPLEGRVPQLVLTPKGKPAVAKPMTSQPALQTLIVRRQVAPQKEFHFFRVDLRGYFGPLPAGKYEFQVLYPKEAFAIDGLPGHKAVDLKSPVMAFEVVTASLKDGVKSYDGNKGAIVREKPPAAEAGDGSAVAMLTNEYKEVMVIPLADGQDPAGKAPLQVRQSFWCRWHPGHGWVIGGTEKEDPKAEKAPVFRLPPGKSVKVVLPDGNLAGDGIYCYMFFVRIDGAGGNSRLAQVYSDPFQVDHVRPPATKDK